MFEVNSEGEAVRFEHMSQWEATNRIPRDEDGPGRETSTAEANLPRYWPTDVGSHYRPALRGAIVASAGVVVGSVGTWAQVLWFTVNGLDFGNWGVAVLILGVTCVIASATVNYWSRTSLHPRWAVAVAWGIVVIGVACSTIAVINIVRLLTVPKGNVFGVPIGVSAGWGLWLVVFSSPVICVTGTMISRQVGASLDQLDFLDKSAGSWSDRWRWAALATSALVVGTGVIYAATNRWKGDSPSGPDSATSPSFPSFPSFPDVSTSSSSSSSPPLSLPSSTQVSAPTTTTSIDAYRYALPGCYFYQDRLADKPKTLTFQTCADGSRRLEAMAWSSWGSAGAQGTGIFSFQVCEPSCAEGHRVQYAANVSAFNPRPAGYNSRCPTDVLFYSEMIISFPASSPDTSEVPTYTMYLGRPAIRFTTSNEAIGQGFLGNIACY